MSQTLRDQLLGLGFNAAKPEPRQRDSARKPKPAHAQPRPASKSPPKSPPKSRSRDDIDLAKAYAIRAQKEKDERIETERIKQDEARKKREAKAKLEAFLQGKAQNAADADHVRHFEYGGKIKRIHVTAAQLAALNAGDLGVVQLNGRYLLVDAATLAEAEAIFAHAVALRVDPNAPVTDAPYSDPQYQVPDDLVW